MDGNGQVARVLTSCAAIFAHGGRREYLRLFDIGGIAFVRGTLNNTEALEIFVNARIFRARARLCLLRNSNLLSQQGELCGRSCGIVRH